MIRELVENYEANKDIVDNLNIHVLPMANPDGYEFSISDVSSYLFYFLLFIDCFLPLCSHLYTKLMRLGVRHRIVDDLDSKPADFDHRFRSD